MRGGTPEAGGLPDHRVLDAVRSVDGRIRETLRFIHDHPELAHQEHACSAYLRRTLAEGHLLVEPGVAGMETAFRATLSGARPGRSVGLVALYDAVPAVRADGAITAVHSCGHGPIAAGVVGAALALAGLRDELPGRIVVMGCPADEIHAPGTLARGGGKALSAAAGVWDGLDAALYAHPEPVDTAWTASRAMRRDTARLHGLRSLRESVPQPPIEGVEKAVEALAGLPREQVMLEHLTLDGDVEEGGGLAMVARFLLWADDEDGLAALGATLRARLDAGWQASAVVPSVQPDERVRQAVLDALRAAGREPLVDPPALPFATDFGAVTRRIPSALLGVGRPEGWAFHTDEGAAQFASPAGLEAALGIAQVLALSAVRLVAPT